MNLTQYSQKIHNRYYDTPDTRKLIRYINFQKEEVHHNKSLQFTATRAVDNMHIATQTIKIYDSYSVLNHPDYEDRDHGSNVFWAPGFYFKDFSYTIEFNPQTYAHTSYHYPDFRIHLCIYPSPFSVPLPINPEEGFVISDAQQNLEDELGRRRYEIINNYSVCRSEYSVFTSRSKKLTIKLKDIQYVPRGYDIRLFFVWGTDPEESITQLPRSYLNCTGNWDVYDPSSSHTSFLGHVEGNADEQFGIL